MPITQQQRDRRRNHLGASDAPAILGVSPWAGPSEIYYAKVAGFEREVGDAAEAGTLLEAPIGAWVARQLGRRLTRRACSVVSQGRDVGIMSANLDFRFPDFQDEAVECKLVGPARSGDWGEEDTDEVPVYVAAQALHQAHVACLQRVWIPVLIVNFRFEFRLYHVDRRQPVIDDIVDREISFWHDHVLPQIPPTDDAPSMDLLKLLPRAPGKVVVINPALVAEYEGRNAAQKAAAEQLDGLKAQLLHLLGDAEAGDFGDADKWLTYFAQKSAPHVDIKAMRNDGVYEKYCIQGEHRTLRIANRPRAGK
jgi:putative phage-type endonuclease